MLPTWPVTFVIDLAHKISSSIYFISPMFLFSANDLDPIPLVILLELPY